MTKESTNNPYVDFRETFNSYADIINNGGANNGVTLSNGVATFDGSSVINYNNKDFTVQKLSAFSIRIKLTTGSYVTSAARLFYSDGNLNGIGLAKFTITISNGTFSAYINTVGGGGGGDSAVMNIAANTSYDIVMTYDGTSIRFYNDGSIEDTETHAFGGAVFDYDDVLHIGGRVSDQRFDGTMDLFEGYYSVLSAEEVSALHKNILYTEPAKEVVGSDLVTNGTFDTDSDWTKQTDVWTISDGKARFDGTASRYLAQTVGFVDGKKYKINFTISGNTSGNAKISIQDADGNIMSPYTFYANGNHEVNFTGSTSSILRLLGLGYVLGPFNLDNVVIKEVTGEVLNVNANRGVIVDEQGNAITNTAVTVVQDAQKVMSFDGGTSKLDCGNPTSLQITGSITLSAWVKFNGSGTQFIIAKDDNTNRNYGLYTSNGSIYMLIFISGAAKQAHTTATTFNDNRWHRIIGINNGTDLLVYVDGKLEPSTGGSGNGGVIDNDTVNLTIGVRANDTSDYLGLLGNVNINNRAWSAEDVARDYNANKKRYGL